MPVYTTPNQDLTTNNTELPDVKYSDPKSRLYDNCQTFTGHSPSKKTSPENSGQSFYWSFLISRILHIQMRTEFWSSHHFHLLPWLHVLMVIVNEKTWYFTGKKYLLSSEPVIIRFFRVADKLRKVWKGHSHMARVTRKQTLRSLLLSYPTKDWWAVGMTPTTKYYSSAFIDYILQSVLYQKF